MYKPASILDYSDRPETLTQQQWEQRKNSNFLESSHHTSSALLSFDIDLGALPKAPREAPAIHKHGGQGLVKLEGQNEHIYLDNRRIVHYRSIRQRSGLPTTGHDVYRELMCLPLLNACVADTLVEQPSIIPKRWKIDAETGNILFTLFLDTIFRNSDGVEWVQAICFGCGSLWQKHAFQLRQLWLPHYQVVIAEDIRLPSNPSECGVGRPCA